MRRKRTVPTLKNIPTTPFNTAEEVWLWFSRCQNNRNDGRKFDASNRLTARPCEPDDVYREVRRLQKIGKLHRYHMLVLGKFGKNELPPDPRNQEEEPASRLWEEALDRLTTPLKRKGIIL